MNILIINAFEKLRGHGKARTIVKGTFSLRLSYFHLRFETGMTVLFTCSDKKSIIKLKRI